MAVLLNEQLLHEMFMIKWELHYLCFFICLTGAEFPVRLQIQESKENQNTKDALHVLPFMRSQKAKNGESDKRSIGYETMTTVSHVDSEVRFIVFSWIFQKLKLS